MLNNRVAWLLGAIVLAAILFITHVWSGGKWTPLILSAELVVSGIAAFLFARRHPESAKSGPEKLSWMGLVRSFGIALASIGLADAIRFWRGNPFDWRQAISLLIGFMLAYLIITPVRNALLNR